MQNPLNTIVITSLIMALIVNWRIRKWQKEAATAYFIIGQKATTSDEREWAYRKAFKYGRPKAKLFYIYAAADTFSRRKPLTPSPLQLTKEKAPSPSYFTTITSEPNISRTPAKNSKKSPRESLNSKTA